MRLSRPFAVLFALFAAGCSGSTLVEHDVDVAVSLDRTTIRPGEQARITVTATNRGWRTVSISGNACPGVFDVRDATGARVAPGPRNCLMAAIVVQLSPGESHVFQNIWAGDGVHGSLTTPRMLPAGVYSLRGVVFGENLRAESEPVQVRIEEG